MFENLLKFGKFLFELFGFDQPLRPPGLARKDLLTRSLWASLGSTERLPQGQDERLKALVKGPTLGNDLSLVLALSLFGE